MTETIDGVPVRRVWLYPAAGRGALKRITNYLSFTFTASLGLVLEGDVDIVFVEAQPLTLAVPALVNKVLRGVPYVYNTPDLQVEYAAEDRWLGARVAVSAARALEALLMRRAVSVTTVTHAFIEHFVNARGLPKERMTFLPNGADTDVLRPLPRDEDLARRLGLEGKRVFLFAGTHAPYQGLDTLMDAARLLHHRDDVVIAMVGEGPLRASLAQQAERDGLSNMRFIDSPFSERAALMSVTTAALASLRPLEISKKMRAAKAPPAFACGVPLIYSGWGETAQMVEAEDVGLVVPPGDATALAHAIEALADDPDRCRAMGQRGRALAEGELSWRFIVADWVRQIEAVRRGEDPRVPARAHPRRADAHESERAA